LFFNVDGGEKRSQKGDDDDGEATTGPLMRDRDYQQGLIYEVL
jgi:hypothetical protein